LSERLISDLIFYVTASHAWNWLPTELKPGL